jgi:hypothetical protein
MKPDQGDRLGERGCLDQSKERFLEGLQPPEIVRRLENPVLEEIRCLWWRALDRVCYGPEPQTRAHVIRGGDHERLVRAFPVVDEMIG